MIRNSIGLVAGVLLSFVLSIAGARLTWLLIIGNVDHSENKDAIVNWILANTFAVAPAVSIIVGGIVGFVVTAVGMVAWWHRGVTTVHLWCYSWGRSH